MISGVVCCYCLRALSGHDITTISASQLALSYYVHVFRTSFWFYNQLHAADVSWNEEGSRGETQLNEHLGGL